MAIKCFFCNNNICRAGKFCYYCGNNIEYFEQTRGKKAQQLAFEYEGNIGILIAGNAGRPAGFLGKKDGSGINKDDWTHDTPSRKNIDKLINAENKYTRKDDYHTQEEDVLASWLRQEKYNSEQLGKPFDIDKVFRNNLGDNALLKDGTSRGRPWGMKYPEKKGGKDITAYWTLQRKDFTHPFHNYLSNTPRFDQVDNYKFSYVLKNKGIWDHKYKKRKAVDLVFVYGPNIGYPLPLWNNKTKQLEFFKESNSTGERTRVKYYDHSIDYPVFRDCVKQSFRSGLQAMADNKIDIAILAYVSGGIYSGKSGDIIEVRVKDKSDKIEVENPDKYKLTSRKIQIDTPIIIEEVLDEDYKGKKLKTYFNKVILPRYP